MKTIKILFKVTDISNIITKGLCLVCLVLMLFSCSASEEKTTAQGETCNCELQHYLFTPIVGGSGAGNYVLQFSEQVDFDCINNEFGNYYQVSNINYSHDKIVCE